MFEKPSAGQVKTIWTIIQIRNTLRERKLYATQAFHHVLFKGQLEIVTKTLERIRSADVNQEQVLGVLVP